MGASYTNILLKGPSQEVVVAFMNAKKRHSYVSPALNGCVVVFDEVCEQEDPQVIAGLARELSRQFKCPAWAVLDHDDDVLNYWLFQNGEPADQYDSTPWYWDDTLPHEPKGGNAQKLAAALSAPTAAPAVEAILRQPQGEPGYVLASQRHSDLLKALNLPLLPVNLGYEYLMRGETPPDFDPSALINAGWE